MPNPDDWDRLLETLGNEPPPPTVVERRLWILVRKDQRAEAVLRDVRGCGVELRFLHNGDLRRSEVYRDDGWQGAAMAVRADLLAKGWVDPTTLTWGS